MSVEFNHVAPDEVDSNVPAPKQGVAFSAPSTQGHGSEALSAFFHMMNEWYAELLWTHPVALQHPPLNVPPLAATYPLALNMVNVHRPLIDKIWKCGAKEFRGKWDNYLEKVEYWLENMQWVLDKLMCPPNDFLRCTISLLKDEAYQWWTTLTVVVPKEREDC